MPVGGWVSFFSSRSTIKPPQSADHQIFISKYIHIFNISKPLSCLQFYNFLCNLNKRDDTLAGISTYDSAFEGLAQRLTDSQWRASDRPKRKNTQPEGIDHANDEMSEASEVSDDYPESMAEADCTGP